LTSSASSFRYGRISADAERVAWIFLNQVPYIGPIRFHKLLLVTKSAQGILEMSALELTQAEVGLDLADYWRSCFVDAKRWAAVEKEFMLEAQGQFRILTELDADYPEPLRHILERPPVLYVKGIWPDSAIKKIGLVGTRRATAYGIGVAERFTRELVKEKISTVSGLAAGIDTVVHETTLKENGYTVAVLGHGLQFRFPSSNRKLFEQIAEKGVLMTEFPYTMAPLAQHFPRRNRIISGLSDAVVVIEAGEKSGALITARYAAEQGRDVFAVPGRLFHETSAGCNRLIKEGAGLATSVTDVLGSHALKKESGTPVLPTTEQVSSEERFLLDALAEEPMTVDEIMLRMGGTVDLWLESLLSLELRKLIYVLPGQRYGRH